MTTNPRVAVIIPCYRYERWLIECVTSLRFQLYRPITVIISHDGCRDWLTTTTAEQMHIEGMEDGYQEIFIFGAKNLGVSHARNEGLEKAVDAKYVWFLDADDMAVPAGIEARVNYLESHPDVSMVWGNARKINVARDNWQWGFQKCLENLDHLERYGRRLNAQSILWRRDVFGRFGGYFEGLNSKEDKELLWRLGIHPDGPLKKRIKAHHIDADVVIYRRHPDAKHKRRVADPKWSARCERDFSLRIADLQEHGITRTNTRFPTWAKAASTAK